MASDLTDFQGEWSMGFLKSRKEKKEKKKQEKAAKKAEKEATPAPAPAPSVQDEPLERPEYLRRSKADLDEVEGVIDLQADQQSRSNILKMYEEKYGESLEAPEFSEGLTYEYQLFEDSGFSTSRDLSFLEEEEETKEEVVVEAAPTKEKGGFFGRKRPKKEETPTSKEATAVAPQEAGPAKPGFFDPEKKVNWKRSGLMCIGVGKPLFPIARIVEYKAREPKTWMKALIIVDLLTIVEIISLLWRLPARIIYEVIQFNKRSKARKAEEAAEAAETKTEKAAKA